MALFSFIYLQLLLDELCGVIINMLVSTKSSRYCYLDILVDSAFYHSQGGK